MMGFWRTKWAALKDPENLSGLEANYRQMMADSLALGALVMPVMWRGDTVIGVMGGIADFARGQLVFAVSGRDMTSDDPAIGLNCNRVSAVVAAADGCGHDSRAIK